MEVLDMALVALHLLITNFSVLRLNAMLFLY
jgi:hypothetical protein